MLTWHQRVTNRRKAYIRMRREIVISYRLFCVIYEAPTDQGPGEQLRRAA